MRIIGNYTIVPNMEVKECSSATSLLYFQNLILFGFVVRIEAYI
jgi:hypothetical protein